VAGKREVPSRRSIMATRTSALALAAVLVSCSMVGPDFVTPDADFADTWSTRDAARIRTAPPKDAAWWRSFNDSTLDRLVSLAYGQNPGLQQAGVNVLRARNWARRSAICILSSNWDSGSISTITAARTSTSTPSERP